MFVASMILHTIHAVTKAYKVLRTLALHNLPKGLRHGRYSTFYHLKNDHWTIKCYFIHEEINSFEHNQCLSAILLNTICNDSTKSCADRDILLHHLWTDHWAIKCQLANKVIMFEITRNILCFPHSRPLIAKLQKVSAISRYLTFSTLMLLLANFNWYKRCKHLKNDWNPGI